MDDMCQSISLGKDDLCQCISFGINDLCQKLSAICHQYRTAPHKFRISAGHILTNCFFATSREVRIYWKEIYNIQTPSFFYIFRCRVKAEFFFGRKMSSGWRFHNFSSYLSFMSSACNFLATLFVRRSQDSPSRVYCLLVELKSTFIWEWKCGSGYNGL